MSGNDILRQLNDEAESDYRRGEEMLHMLDTNPEFRAKFEAWSKPPDPIIFDPILAQFPQQVSREIIKQGCQQTDYLTCITSDDDQVLIVGLNQVATCKPTGHQAKGLQNFAREHFDCWLEVPPQGLKIQWNAMHAPNTDPPVVDIWAEVTTLAELADDQDLPGTTIDNLYDLSGRIIEVSVRILGLGILRYHPNGDLIRVD